MSLRVAAYCRVSTDQDDQKNSLQNQKDYFTQYIQNHSDWSLVEIYADEGMSGTTTQKRRAFQTMIADAEGGEIDLILTKEVSRFSRNTIDTIAHIRHLQAIGVGVIFINDGIDTREKDGELRLTIMASIAQEESRKTSQRVKWGQKRSMERGVVFGNDSTYGYETKEGKLFVRPEQAEVIRLIYHKFLDEEKGTHVIARELYEQKINAPQSGNKPWSAAMIYRILRNEKYCGDLLQKKYVTVDHLTHKKIQNDGREAQIYLKDHHEAIVSRERFRCVQKELARRNGNKGKKRYSNRYWCSGKIRCSECGSPFILRKSKRSNGEAYCGWCCYTRVHYGKSKWNAEGNLVGCDMPSINEKSLVACVTYVMEQLDCDWQSIVDTLLGELENTQDTGSMQQEKKVRRKMLALEQKKEKALDAYLSETISKMEMQTMKNHYDGEIARQQERLDRITKDQKCSWQQQLEPLEIQKLLMNDLRTSKEVFAEVIEQIVVSHRDIRIRIRSVPVWFCLQYQVRGRGRTYRTEITSCEIIKEEENQHPAKAGC